MTLSAAAFTFFGVVGGLAVLYVAAGSNWIATRIIGSIAYVVIPAGVLSFIALTAYACITGAHRAGPIVLPHEAHPARTGLEAVAVGLVLAALGVLDAVATVQYRRRRGGYARPGGA